MEGLAARGAIGFKAFMSNSGVDDFRAADDATLFADERAARLDLPVAVHAENNTLTASLAARAISEGRTGVRDYSASRPVIAEVEAMTWAILFAEETACALHVVHVSTGGGLAFIAEARRRGVDVTAETCPHYLLFDEEDAERLGALATHRRCGRGARSRLCGRRWPLATCRSWPPIICPSRRLVPGQPYCWAWPTLLVVEDERLFQQLLSL